MRASRLFASLAIGVLVCAAPIARADDRGPPFDEARGLADATTGTIGSVMARTGLPPNAAYSSVQAGVLGAVGIRAASDPGRVHASAAVELVQAVAADPDAAVCVQIRGDGLPNLSEGGGPVCRFLDDPLFAHRIDAVSLEVSADFAAPHGVVAEAFVSWKSPHPLETGAVLGVARVTRLSFVPAS